MRSNPLIFIGPALILVGAGVSLWSSYSKPEPKPKPVMGVELNCGTSLDDKYRGKMIIIDGSKTAVVHLGSFRREVDLTGKVCAIDSVDISPDLTELQ